jgi:hypothetical protein
MNQELIMVMPVLIPSLFDPERMRKLSEAHDRFMRKLEAKAT